MKAAKSTILVTFIFCLLISCSRKCTDIGCKEIVFVDGYSGKDIIMHYPIIEDLNTLWLSSMLSKKYKIDSFKIKISFYKRTNTKPIILLNKGPLITKEFSETIILYLSKVKEVNFYDFEIVDVNSGKKVKLKTNKFIKIKLLDTQTVPYDMQDQ